MKYTFCTILILVTYTTLFSQKYQQNNSAYIIQDSVSIPTRSGISISSIIVRKKENITPLPVILFYTTYYQDINDSFFGKIAAEKDYIGIVAYARGIKTNLKDYAPYENEKTDVYDIIDWISKQLWCNGSIGMYGGSYTGYSQWAAVKNCHPALKTIVPQAPVMPGFDVPMENNVPINLNLNWSNDNIYKRNSLRNSLPFEWFETGIAFKSMDSLAGYSNPIFQKQLEHPDYDTYWRSMVPTPKEYTTIQIPVLTTTGYYDGDQIGALQYYINHTKYNNKANHYFVIGPYDHWGAQRRASKKLMGYEIDSVANLNMMELAFEWLDYILKGKPKPDLLKDKFNYQVMGTNEWKHATSIKTINNDTLTFYLDGENLVTKKPKKKGFKKLTVDFKDRVNQNNYFTRNILMDSLEISNGLVFTSQVFDKEFTINGSFIGNLNATINKKDMDITLVLYEILPNGSYFSLSRFIGRASYAKDNTTRQLLKPYKKENIPFQNTRFVSKKISKGSRLLIVLNINKHPFEIINYGSGKPVANETIKDAGKALEIKWHNDSYIKIPVWIETYN